METWREHGWVLLEGLVDIAVIDAAAQELQDLFPTAEQYHGDPSAVTERWLGRPPALRPSFTWPPDGPGFRPEQHLWHAEFPFPGHQLNRLCVHPALADFARRALGTDDLRLYQAGLSAKYTGFTNYEQPMHTDRNHSWLASLSEPPWGHVEGFLYLCDVEGGLAPTHLVSVQDSARHATTVPLVMPDEDPALYHAERPASGRRGSYLAYRSDVFHRAVNLTEPGGARFLLNASFKAADHDWIAYSSWQSNATSLDWVAFVEACTPSELALFGFPLPGHPVWTPALIEATALRYPKLDLAPWRAALGGA